MCCERLVCAACSGQVVEAGCGVCAAARSRLHPGAPHAHVPDWLAALALLLVAAALQVTLA